MEQNSDVIEGEVIDRERKSALPAPQQDGLAPIDIKQFQAYAESRRQALEILMNMGIAATRPEDWSNQQGKPYPEQGACSSIINMVGITITSPARRKEMFEDEKGSYYAYILEADVSVPRFGIGPLPIVGRATSRDQFFAVSKGDLRPASEIDPGDILAKAYTNLRYRAVKAVVDGIAGMTWDRLKELTGGRVSKEKVKQIQYGEQAEAPEGGGNCPTCHKYNLKKVEKKDGGFFWACEGGRWDKETKKIVGCPHRQNEPPDETAAAGEPSQTGKADSPAGDKMDAVNTLMAYMKQKHGMGPTGVWREFSAFLNREVDNPAAVTAEEVQAFYETQRKA